MGELQKQKDSGAPATASKAAVKLAGNEQKLLNARSTMEATGAALKTQLDKVGL